MQSPKNSINPNTNSGRISLFNATGFNFGTTKILVTPVKCSEKTSFIGYPYNDILNGQFDENYQHARSPSIRKATRSSIFFHQNKRNSSISINPRKPSFLMDEENRNKKKIINELDVYSEEQLIHIAIKILQKPKNYRSSTDLKMLIRCTEKIGFFSEMINNQEADKHEECCKAMNYKFGKPGEIIFKEGSIGETFYIILKGSVGIFKESSDTPLATFNIKDDNNSLKIRKKSALLLTPSNPQLKSSNSRLKENQTNNDNNTNENINKIKILKAGEAFGELSLIDGRPRAATVICEQECHLAILEKQYFDKILKDLEKKKLFKQIEFFSSLRLFSSWSYNAVKNLYYLTTQLEFKKFKTVYKQNDSPGDVYIIKSGEFKVVKSIDHEEKLLVNNDHILMSRNANKKTNKLEICLLGPGEAFGEEEVVQKINRLHTVVCNSITGSVFVIDHKEFLKRVYLSQTAKKQLKEQIISKNEWREKRYDDNFTENQTILYSYPKNSDNKNNEKNGDPDEFAMIKSNTTRNKNFITNWKEVYSNPLNILARKPREKIKMNPVMENIVDPKTLIFSLNGKNFLKEMTANSPKRNFFILTNALRKEKTSKNQNNERKKRKKTPQKTTENTERKKEELSNRESDKKDDNPIKFNFKQILLPISNTSINNFLKMKKNNSDDEYQIFSNPILNSRKKTVKRIMLSQDNSHKGEKHFENLIIEGKISKDSPKSAFGEKSRSVDLNNEYMRLLPLKYSSEHIKRNHKLCFLTSSSPLMRKISRNEFFSEDECLTSRHY